MKRSHRCPKCSAYNNVTDGKPNGNVDEFSYICTECGVQWDREICQNCLGTEFDGLDPCGCDGGFIPAGTITFVLPGEKLQGPLLFGSKVNQGKNPNPDTGAF